jgi:phospholipid/cholesterol/gamma-HCH transport system substrate-binding protein
MEIRARYLTIGLFTLGMIAAGFLFVYWLYNSGGLGRRDHYHVLFKGSVAGLTTGSPVTFNGVRLGEVTFITLYAADPRQVLVGIAVADGTPLNSDTKAGLDFQGLTGAATVTLAGGDPKAAPLEPNRPGDLPFLTANADASLSMTQAVRAALQKFDVMLSENADPLKSTIGNLNSFTTALARNSDRVDGILAGLERMTGGAGKKGGGLVVDLAPPKSLSLIAKVPAGQIAINEPTALGTLDTDKLTLDPAAAPDAAAASWADALPKLMQARLVQSFENAGMVGSVVRGDGSTSDYLLQNDLRSFGISTDGGPAAELELSAKLVNAKGRVLAGRIFKSKVALASSDPKIAAAALNEAFGRTAQELIGWTVGVVAALPPPPPEDAAPAP